MGAEQNGIGRHFARMEGYDSTVGGWVASPPFSAGGGGGGSTQVAVSSVAGVVATNPFSTSWAGSAGFHFNSSGELLTAGAASAGSTQVSVSNFSTQVSISGNSTVVQGTSPWVMAGNSTVVQGTSPWVIAGNSTVIQGTNPWTVAGNCTVAPLAGSTWATRPIQSSAADLQMTATPAAGSTWATRPIQSSRADLNVTAWTADSAGALIESSTRAQGTNSTMRGLAVRSLMPDSTGASGRAGSSGDTTVISSAATGIYVYAYSVSYRGSTVATEVTARFLNGSTNERWRCVMGFLGQSTGNLGFAASDQLAVSPPAYLFRTAAGNALLLNTTSSGVNFSVAAWRE